MPLTEDDLRAVLRDRTASVPSTPDLTERVKERVRRRRRTELAAGALALVVVLAGAALVVVPRPTATPPVGTTPTPTPSPARTIVTGPQTVGGLEVTTEGPVAVTGTAPFGLTITVHNTAATPWTGSVSIGLVHDAVFPGWFDGGVITSTGDPNQVSDLGATLPDTHLVNGQQVTRSFDGLTVNGKQTVPAGGTRTWTFAAARNAQTAVPNGVVGWIPLLDSGSVKTLAMGDLGVATPIAVTPSSSSLPCATVSITSTSQATPTAWQVNEAATAVVGTNGAARWVDVAGLDPQQMTLTPSGIGDSRVTTIARAITDTGVGRPSAFGPAAAKRPATLAPGRYVTYTAYTLLPISFTGTCSPSGDAISGTWWSYDQIDGGIVDCATTPLAGSAGAVVEKKYCPR
jgi:hypothetical protein